MEALYAGPWSWDGSYPIRVVDYAGYIVCEGIMPARHRDAVLITASPELLSLLIQLDENIERLGHGHYMLESREGFNAEAFIANVRNALSKATGTTHD